MKRNANHHLHTPVRKWRQMSPISQSEEVIVESDFSQSQKGHELLYDLAGYSLHHFTPRSPSPSIDDEISGELSHSFPSETDLSPEKQNSFTVRDTKNDVETTQKRIPLNVIDSNRKGCNCKQSKCQKGYCDCLKIGLVCQPGLCSCEDCQNTQENEKHKEIQKKLELSETANKGCKCRKSQCLKKYCECHNGGRKCGSHCECSGCLNRDENIAPEGDQEILKKLRRTREARQDNLVQ